MKEKSKVKSESNAPASYKAAVEELESILSEIEDGEADVDVLSEKVKRALFLIRYCRARLKHTDDEVRKLISGFEKEGEE